MLAPLLALAAVASADPTPLDSRVDAVVVYTQSAQVLRVAEVPAPTADVRGATRRFVVDGLPGAIDANGVRVGCDGGRVVSFEVLPGLGATAPDPRLAELQRRLASLSRERDAISDELAVLERLAAHLDAALVLEGDHRSEQIAAGTRDLAHWRASLAFFGEQLGALAGERRELEAELTRLDREIETVKLELGERRDRTSQPRHRVEVGVAADGPATLRVEYTVWGAGWRPRYDVFTASDARAAELVYRADVWQQSGEDWTDVELALSTSQPQRGARGPDPRPIALRVQERVEVASRLHALGYLGADDDADEEGLSSAFAAKAPPVAVLDSGLSVRFALAARETVASRDRPSTVLVGRAKLDVRPEYFATPATSDAVWLRGVVEHTGPWPLLPGTASVFLGADAVGHATFDAPVQPGQEFTLHLGADPALTVERVSLVDLREGPGFFGNERTVTEGWRLHLENHGALVVDADGAATVWVREALPVARNDAIEIEITSMTPRPSTDPRWQADHDERGIETWRVRVPAGGDADVRYTLEISHPDDLEIVRERG